MQVRPYAASLDPEVAAEANRLLNEIAQATVRLTQAKPEKKRDDGTTAPVSARIDPDSPAFEEAVMTWLSDKESAFREKAFRLARASPARSASAKRPKRPVARLKYPPPRRRPSRQGHPLAWVTVSVAIVLLAGAVFKGIGGISDNEPASPAPRPESAATTPATGETAQSEASKPDRPRRISARSLADTAWVGTTSDGVSCVFEYLGDRMLRCTTPDGTHSDATWSQNGHEVHMEMHGGQSEWHGIVVLRRITGNGQNVHGHKWSWDVEEIERSDAARQIAAVHNSRAVSPLGLSTGATESTPSLAGTKWSALLPSVGGATLRFLGGSDRTHPNQGVYRCTTTVAPGTYRREETLEEGTWTQDDDRIYMRSNNQRFSYRGTVRGNGIYGTMAGGQLWSAVRLDGTEANHPRY